MADLEQWRGFIADAEDVLFFRDSKPATLGADHYLRSLFPPFPATLYGMLRTCRLAATGRDLDKLGEKTWTELDAATRGEVGEWGSLGSLRLRGPWLVRDNGDNQQILLPAPADLGVIVNEADAVEQVVRYLPVNEAGGAWSHDLALLVPHERQNGGWRPWRGDARNQPQPAADWFVTFGGLAQWLMGALPDRSAMVKSDALWMSEQRTGVGIRKGDQRLAADGMLYTFGFVRMKRGVSLGFEICGSSIEPGVTAILGGEGRLVTLRHGPSISSNLAAQAAQAMRTLYLATPAVFGGPIASQPSNVAVTAAAVRSMIHAGGWDLARKRPKPLRRAVPAGAVYFTSQTDVTSFMNISEGHEEGFGVVLAGVC